MIKIEKIDSPEELFLLIKKERKAVFEFIYKKYSAMLFGMAMASVDSREIASDILEATFLKLWQGSCFSGQKTSVSVYIIQIHLKTISDYKTSKSYTSTNISNNIDSLTKESSINLNEKFSQHEIAIPSL